MVDEQSVADRRSSYGSDDDLLAGALSLASAGYHPVPVAPNRKVPIYSYRKPSGFDNKLKTKDGVIDAWSANPQANVAISLDGLVEVDMDSSEATDAVMSVFSGDTLSIKTPRFETGDGGLRLLFRDEPGILRAKKNRPRQLVEWQRGPTLVALMPPSIFVGDSYVGSYSYETDLHAELASISDYPGLVELLEPTKRGAVEKPDTEPKSILPDFVPVGERNSQLAATAALLRGLGFSTHELEITMLGLNEGGRLESPLSQSEVQSIVKSAATARPLPWKGPHSERLIARAREVGHLSMYGVGVLRALLNRCDAQGVCDPGPSLVSLGNSVGCCDKNARRGLRELETAGLLVWQRGHRGKASRHELRLDGLY